MEESSQDLTLQKNSWQLRNAECRRNSLAQGRTHQLVIQYHWLALETYAQETHIQQVVFMNINKYTHV